MDGRYSVIVQDIIDSYSAPDKASFEEAMQSSSRIVKPNASIIENDNGEDEEHARENSPTLGDLRIRRLLQDKKEGLMTTMIIMALS